MQVTVRLFARAKDLAGTNSIRIALADGSTVGELRRVLGQEQPRLAGLLERSLLAVNDEFADDATVLPQGVEVALLPPVSGG